MADTPTTVTDKATLKTYFEIGDQPTEPQFAELIDSLAGAAEVTAGTPYLVPSGRLMVIGAGIYLNALTLGLNFTVEVDAVLIIEERGFLVTNGENLINFGHIINNGTILTNGGAYNEDSETGEYEGEGILNTNP